MAKFIVTIREELVKEVGVLPEDHCDTNFEVR